MQKSLAKLKMMASNLEQFRTEENQGQIVKMDPNPSNQNPQNPQNLQNLQNPPKVKKIDKFVLEEKIFCFPVYCGTILGS